MINYLDSLQILKLKIRKVTPCREPRYSEEKKYYIPCVGSRPDQNSWPLLSYPRTQIEINTKTMSLSKIQLQLGLYQKLNLRK